MNSALPSITVIGQGKVGSAIHALAQNAHLDSLSIPARKLTSVSNFSGLVILAVRDDHIAEMDEKLSKNGLLTPGTVFAHCSGSLSSEILTHAKMAGCHVGSFHPLQTFPSVEAAVERLPGSYCFVEGDPIAVESLLCFGKTIARDAFPLSREGKTVYHLAAVFASNYLTGIIDLSFRLAAAAGISPQDAPRVFAPLIQATLANINEYGTANALTGPIARGDMRSIGRHLEVLRESLPQELPLYTALGRITAQLALRGNKISPDVAAQIYQLLQTSD